MTTGDVGDAQQEGCLSRVIPKFLTAPSSGTMTNYYRQNLGDSLTTDMATPMDASNRFDVLRSARWHRARFDFVGDHELALLNVDFAGAGSE
jgi:hypothetical protein